MKKTSPQAEWAARAKEVLPAGGLGNFDPSIFISHGKAARVWDEDGNEFVDYLIGSGPMLLGHGNEEVQEAIFEQIPKGMTFFANNSAGVELAEEICNAMPCGEKLRFVASGGEANMYALRLARAFTGRSKILKFEGGYHGMSAEAQMSLAPTQQANFPQPIPDSAGIPDSVASEMVIAPFNDFDYVKSILAEYGADIAAIIVEPLQRIVPPLPGFLQLLRDEADKHGIILIFDEVVTGFRFAYGGAQAHYGVTPDLCALGKVIGGGFPLGAVVGRADIMAHFDAQIVGRDKWLMQMGTLAGNPVAAVAGLKTLEILRRPGTYEKLNLFGNSIMDMTRTALDAVGLPYQIVGEPSLFEVVFTPHPVRNYRDVLNADTTATNRYHAALHQLGIFKSAAKTYPCLALTDEDLAITEAAITRASKYLIN
ncbi:aminotransferase class III-fold pyridoxal phosphate-dependent enzyme [Phaeobacter sp. NW0010-22]|uniref:aspartate aminotransferase family protein n=1 Tax=Phaeobacter sp. NW0010-22 TaxID=3135907 RepID=UPI003101B4FA